MELRIDRIGARGDGIADTENGPVYVPLTSPGDRIRARRTAERGHGIAAEIVEMLSSGGLRREPDCSHFGVCGGCDLQHLAADYYLEWKRERVAEPLRQRGVETDVALPVSVPPRSRRRVRLAFRRVSGRLLIGFRERETTRIVDLEACPVTSPAILAALPSLRAFLLRHAGAGEIAVTAVKAGLDVVVSADETLSLGARMDVAALCEEAEIARFSWSAGDDRLPEPIVTRKPVRVSFGGAQVALPAGTFLQPTVEGEEELRQFVLKAVGNAHRVADLYAGCGAFALPLAGAGHTVEAFERDPAPVRALHDADGKIAYEVRDLRRQPLRVPELERFDAVVLDPPRAGAAEQCAQLAESTVPRIVYVSCNPASFARDARMLTDSGYTLERVQPVDQFLWSHHVELASVFERP